MIIQKSPIFIYDYLDYLKGLEKIDVFCFLENIFLLLFLHFFRQMKTTCLLRDICLCHVKSFNILNGTKQECQEKNVAVKSNMISFQIRIAFLLSKNTNIFLYLRHETSYSFHSSSHRSNFFRTL